MFTVFLKIKCSLGEQKRLKNIFLNLTNKINDGAHNYNIIKENYNKCTTLKTDTILYTFIKK